VRNVRLGIIGTGNAARELHLPALKNMTDQFTVIAVCNRSEEKAKSFAKLIGDVPYYTDYKKIISDNEIEAVDITLPSDISAAVVKKAILSKKHVITEKPLAGYIDQAEKLVTLAANTEKVTMVAENFRYMEVYNKINTILSENRIGVPILFYYNFFRRFDENTTQFAKPKWIKGHNYAGGILNLGGIHHIAGIRTMIGNLIVVSSLTKCLNPNISDLDTACIHCKTNDGLVGVINISYGSKHYESMDIIILGEKASIKANYTNIVIMKEGNEIEKVLLPEKPYREWGFKEEFQDFYEAITTGKKCKSSFKEAYEDLKVINDLLKHP